MHFNLIKYVDFHFVIEVQGKLLFFKQINIKYKLCCRWQGKYVELKHIKHQLDARNVIVNGY